MTSIESVTIEAAGQTAAQRFYDAAFESDAPVRVRPAATPTDGFRGFSLSGGPGVRQG
jgi:hypothetical protein